MKRSVRHHTILSRVELTRQLAPVWPLIVFGLPSEEDNVGAGVGPVLHLCWLCFEKVIILVGFDAEEGKLRLPRTAWGNLDS